MRAFAVVAVVTLIAGVVALASSVLRYLDAWLPIDSDAGLLVFRVGGSGYVSYHPYVVGVEPAVIGVGMAMLVAAAFLAATVRARRLGRTGGS